MTSIDRMGSRGVLILVRSTLFALVVSLAASCGGGAVSKGGAGTTPAKAETPKDTGPVEATPATPEVTAEADEAKPAATDEPDWDAPASAPEDVEPVLPQPKKPEPPKADAPRPKPAPIKPPGNDLPPERKIAMVAEFLRTGGAAIRSRDSDKAINEAKKALAIDETNVEAMIVLAHAYYLKEFDDKALAILKDAQKFPDGQRHAVGWMLTGLLLDRAGKESDALAAYEQATSINPDYAAALNNAGVIYLNRKRYADAIVVFERVTRLRSNGARGHNHLGASYRGRSSEAADGSEREQLLRRAEMELKLAMSQDTNYAPAYFNLGLLYLDADPFPGLDTALRLQNAQRYLVEYKRVAGPRAGTQVDDFLAAAQKGYDREMRALEKKKKQQEKDRQKAKEAAAEPPKPAEPAPAPPATTAPPPPPPATGSDLPKDLE